MPSRTPRFLSPPPPANPQWEGPPSVIVANLQTLGHIPRDRYRASPRNNTAVQAVTLSDGLSNIFFPPHCGGGCWGGGSEGVIRGRGSSSSNNKRGLFLPPPARPGLALCVISHKHAKHMKSGGLVRAQKEHFLFVFYMCVCVYARAADKASFYDYVFFLHCIRLHLEAALVLFLLLFRRRNIFSMTTVEAVIASCFYTGPRIYRHIFMLPLCACVCM